MSEVISRDLTLLKTFDALEVAAGRFKTHGERSRLNRTIIASCCTTLENKSGADELEPGQERRLSTRGSEPFRRIKMIQEIKEPAWSRHGGSGGQR